MLAKSELWRAAAAHAAHGVSMCQALMGAGCLSAGRRAREDGAAHPAVQAEGRRGEGSLALTIWLQPGKTSKSASRNRAIQVLGAMKHF